MTYREDALYQNAGPHLGNLVAAPSNGVLEHGVGRQRLDLPALRNIDLYCLVQVIGIPERNRDRSFLRRKWIAGTGAEIKWLDYQPITGRNQRLVRCLLGELQLLTSAVKIIDPQRIKLDIRKFVDKFFLGDCQPLLRGLFQQKHP